MAENSAREQVKALTDRLEQGVRELFDSQKFADYLKTMARFYRYSARNVLLIHMQMPEATRVAGYGAWQTKFGRHVKQGEKGLKILAPTPFTVKKEQQRTDPNTGKPVIGLDGLPETEQVEVRIPRFKATTVFDISQTDGKPLPELAEDIHGDVRHYEVFIAALREVSPLPIVFEALGEGTDGLCRYGRDIAIREGMSERQTISALIHEITHAKIHDISLEQEAGNQKSRGAKEVEAEGVSYAVCQYYGIETGANSFGYLATWSKDRQLKELSASLETIRSTAAALIGGIDDSFRAIAKTQGIELATGAQAPMVSEAAEMPVPADTPQAEQAQTGAGMERPSPGSVYARYANRIAELAGTNNAYANAVLNADEQNAKTECEAAIRAGVLGLLMESTEHIELYRQYMENPDFKGRLEDYVFSKTYLEPRTARRQAEDAPAGEAPLQEPPPQAGSIQPLLETRPVGTTVLMPLVFNNDGQFERGGHRTKVRIEAPIGKYPVYSRERNGRVDGYLLTESGRLLYISDHGRMANLTEAQIDENFAQRRKAFEESLQDPEAWADYNAAAVANRLEEAEAHNIPVRKAKEERRQRAIAENEARQEAERLEQEAAFDLKIDEMGLALLRGERVEVELAHYTAKNPVFALFERHGIELPLATKGWINRNLKALQIGEDGRITAWGPRGMKISNTFMHRLHELKLALAAKQEAQPEKEAVVHGAEMNGAGDGEMPPDHADTPAIPLDETSAVPPAETPKPVETGMAEMPDPAIGYAERDLYGYTAPDMLPLLKERALALFDAEHTVYLLHPDNTEEIAFERSDIEGHDGIFGIESADWALIRQQEQAVMGDEGAREARLLYETGDCFGIYQLKPGEELHPYRFASLKELDKARLSPDRANYTLIYTAPLAENDTPEAIFQRFNANRPADFTGHSLSVSDVLVLKQDNALTSLYTDSFGFEALPGFLGGETPAQQQAENPASQDEKPPEQAPGQPTVAELEAQVRAGKQISLTELANAIQRERRDTAGKEKPSVLAQLREYKGAAQADKKPPPMRVNDSEREM